MLGIIYYMVPTSTVTIVEKWLHGSASLQLAYNYSGKLVFPVEVIIRTGQPGGRRRRDVRDI